MRLAILLFLGSSASAQAACVIVDRSSVTAGDLASVLPEFRLIRADRRLLWAPVPGLTRLLTGPEVQQLAAKESLTVPPGTTVCLQRRTVLFSEEQVVAALRERLPAGAELRLVDYCRLPVMPGRLRFASRPLIRNAGGRPELHWKGTVIDDDQRTAPFWAVVQVLISRQVVRAVRPIPVNTLLSGDDVAESVEQSSLVDDVPPLRLADLVGKEARRPIDAKQVIQLAWLREPLLIRKGQAVRVMVESGQTRLGLDGRALNGGNLGATLLVKSDENGRMFRAQVTGPGMVAVRMEANAR